MSPTILIAGAVGPIGQYLIRELVGRSQPVRVLTRRVPGLTQRHYDPFVEYVGTSPDAIGAPDGLLDGIEHVVFLSPPAPDQVMWNGVLIEAAERTGRPIHLVPVLAMGAVATDAALQFVRWHTVTIAQMRSSDLPVTELHPQLLMQNLLPSATSVRRDDLIFGAYGGARLPQIDAQDVAAAVATVLTTETHRGGTHVLTGPQSLSYPEVADALSRVTGRVIRYVDMAPEAFHEHLIGNGVPPWKADDLAQLGRLFQQDHAWPVSSTMAELTGRPARPLHQFLRTHAGAFRPDGTPGLQHAGLPSFFLL